MNENGSKKMTAHEAFIKWTTAACFAALLISATLWLCAWMLESVYG